MSGLKTSLLAALVALPIAAQSGPLPATPADRALAFADCAGRYAAVAAHLSLFGGEGVDAAYSARADFALLLDAVLPDAAGQGLDAARARAVTITARAAQGEFLSRAHFDLDPVVAKAYAIAAEAQIERCRSLRLGV